tara:strand:- start:108 stop:1004 length:897 start_codon:yes stop_codon:yes gene_type:complete
MMIFNIIYERSSYKFVEIFVRHVKIPNKSFNWTIIPITKKKIKTKIYKDNSKTWQFALSYKWHDPAINNLEKIITGYLHGKENNYWIDCGANLGLRSLAALSMNIKTFMIEPNKETNKLNKERCEQNNFIDYEILPFGVSSIDGESKLFIDKSSYLSSLSENQFDNENLEKTEIITLRKLDTLFSKEIEYEQIDAFIKIDVEGHEKEVLVGAQNLIQKHEPTFLIEINEKGEHIKNIIDDMREKKYTVYQTNTNNSNDFCLKHIPNNIENYDFNSNDFLFVKDDNLINTLHKFTEPDV